jgi:hypothetical protein
VERRRGEGYDAFAVLAADREAPIHARKIHFRPHALAAALLIGSLAPPQPCLAGDEEPEDQETSTRAGGTDLEKKVRRLRNGAGLRVNAWQVRDVPRLAGADESESPLFEGDFAKGLDLHLVLENTVGFYRRSEETGAERLDAYVVPLLSTIKFYPWTRPEDSLEPFLEGGAGFSIGVEERETTTTGLLGGTTTDRSSSTVMGFGLKVGPGLDWRFSRALGLTVGGRYQWIRFTDEVGGVRTYQGIGFDAGLTYRFQYE